MKKIILSVALATVVFASCKKDYNCVCDTSYNTTVQPSTTSTFVIHNTKTKAALDCNNRAVITNAIATTCYIK